MHTPGLKPLHRTEDSGGPRLKPLGYLDAKGRTERLTAEAQGHSKAKARAGRFTAEALGHLSLGLDFVHGWWIRREVLDEW
jgi:hypothetical protein